MDFKSFRKVAYSYIFICLVIGLIFLFVSDLSIEGNQIVVIITFFINGLLITKNLFQKSDLGYSLKDIVYLFMFLFMFLSPIIQYTTESFPWWDTHLINDNYVILTNIMVLIFLLFYQLGYLARPRYQNNRGLKKINHENRITNIFLIASIIASFVVISLVGFQNLFSRSTYNINVSSKSVALIIANTFRAVPVIYVALIITSIKKSGVSFKKKKISLSIGILLMTLINFPTATARFWMASIYIGLFIIILGRSKNPYFLKMILLFGMIFIFPVINIFRRNSWIEILSLKIEVPSVTESLKYGDFDAYSMLARSIIYTNSNGIVWGRQLLGNLLFFVPRAIWPEKPIGSGALIATKLGWEFSNVSFPYIAEGYLNFGIMGVILFSYILGVISKVFDNKYVTSLEKHINNINYVDIVYPFSLGFLFFIMRGDLLSSLSFYIGFMIPIIIVFVIQKLFINDNMNNAYLYRNDPML